MPILKNRWLISGFMLEQTDIFNMAYITRIRQDKRSIGLLIFIFSQLYPGGMLVIVAVI